MGIVNGEEKLRTKIIEAIQHYNKKLNDNTEYIKFRCSMNDDQYEKTMSYNEILQYI